MYSMLGRSSFLYECRIPLGLHTSVREACTPRDLFAIMLGYDFDLRLQVQARYLVANLALEAHTYPTLLHIHGELASHLWEPIFWSFAYRFHAHESRVDNRKRKHRTPWGEKNAIVLFMVCSIVYIRLIDSTDLSDMNIVLNTAPPKYYSTV